MIHIPIDFRRHHLWEVGIISIAALLIVGGTLSWVAYDEYLQSEESEYRLLEAHARNADVQVEEALDNITQLLSRIVAERLRHPLQSKVLIAEFDRSRAEVPNLDTLLVTDATGRIRVSNNAAIIGRDVSRESYFTAQLHGDEQPKLFMSRPDKLLLGVPAVTFSLPVFTDGHQFAGIVGVTIGYRFFPGVLQAVNSDDSASMSVIFNRDGDLVFRRDEPEKFFGYNIVKVSEVFREHFREGAAVTRHIGPSAQDGKTRIFLVRDVGDTGLSLILSRQLGEVLAKWQRNIIIYTSIFLFTAVVVVFLAILAARRRLEILSGREILAAAKLRAEDANVAKSKFLAAASHDLRQPIHAQGLFLEALARTDLNAHQQEILASANAASKSSVEMLNTLLDFSRIEAGVVKPYIRSFRLQPLLNKIEREFEAQADAKGLVYRSRETNLVVRSDPMLVELILRNLVSNAIRYTERGGLLLACRKRGGQAVLEVWDTGVGIAPAYQKEVFREFHQLGNPERDQRKGLGLGLAIAEGLARVLEHPLTLTSIPQRGSVFKLSLPVVSEAEDEQYDLKLRQNRAQVLNLRVLVIDDDETVRMGMQHLLRGWGCKCEVAESIEEAIALARVHAPDLVISDYRLREQRSGLEAIAALRTLLGDALPALLITGDTAPDRLREAQASGIPLLHKPVSPGQLYRGIVMAARKLTLPKTRRKQYQEGEDFQSAN